MAVSTKARTVKPRNEITAEYVRSILAYDPNTGIFRWKNRSDVSACANQRFGKVAGFADKDGYTVIQIWTRRYCAHRLAWLVTTGAWPAKDIDHINGDRRDCRLANLREATRQQNLRNMKLRPNNKSGFKWVSWSKATKSWKAQIRDGNTNLYLGSFKTREEAHATACEAARKLHKEFARTN